MEDWALGELEKGCQADDVIQQILEGNECIAALGTAAAVVAQSEAVSETSFALASSQRLLSADDDRRKHDFANKTSGLIGFRGKGDLPHYEAIKRINARPIRAETLSRHVGKLFLFAGIEFRERIKNAVEGFRENLPFRYEEWRKDPQASENLLAEAGEYEALVRLDNYQRVEIEDQPETLAVVHVDPKANDPETHARLLAATRWLRRGTLWSWAATFFEKGELDGSWQISTAIKFAKELEVDPLEEPHPDPASGPGAIAAVAAMTLAMSVDQAPEDLLWARQILRQSVLTPEARDTFWSPMTVIPWHPGIFAAYGLAREFRSNGASRHIRDLLLRLVAHPLDGVSQAAIKECLSLWDVDSRFAWSALHLYLSLCAVPPRQNVAHNEPYQTEAARDAAVSRTIAIADQTGQWEPLPLPPPASIKSDRPTSGERSFDDDGYVEDDDMVDPNEVWVRNPIWWNGKHASEALAYVPVARVIVSDAADAFERFLADGLQWTISAMSPPWIKKGRRDSSTRIFEWQHAFGSLLGKAAGCYPLPKMRDEILEPIFQQDDEHCWSLLQPLVSTYLGPFYDDDAMPGEAPELLLLALERVLKDRGFREDGYRSGEFHGHDLARLIEDLMFVSIEKAGGAKRFVNGDWSEIGKIMPIIDRIVRAGGWSSNIMSKFLTLCERAKEFYPSEVFADQILDLVGKPGRDFEAWRGTFIPARIAGLVQHFADRDTPMSPALGQKMLRILDHFVDMGDRRSAAMQLSETFREIQTARAD